MGIWFRLYRRFLIAPLLPGDLQVTAQYSNGELLKEAHRELLWAYNMFDRMLDEEMVDCAVFSINAAEKRYSYLLKQIKQEQVRYNEGKMLQLQAGSGVE